VSTINVVLLGAGGQLGRTIAADWQQGDEIGALADANEPAVVTKPAIRLHCFDRSELDICQPDQFSELLDGLDPQVVINAAAYTQVDKAESEADQAMRINRDGAANVAQWTAANGCRLIHLSTDFVFSGNAAIPYAPEDATVPVNHYGLSKLEGESAIGRTYSGGSLIIRTSWLYSRYQPNFVTTMLRLMRERDQLGVVADQVGTPTSTHSLTRLIGSAINNNVSSGIFHWSDAGVASWYDFAVAIQEEALAVGLLESAIPISPIKTSDYPTPATRPSYSVMDKSASYETFSINAIHWRTELRRVIEELNEARDST